MRQSNTLDDQLQRIIEDQHSDQLFCIRIPNASKEQSSWLMAECKRMGLFAMIQTNEYSND